MKILIYRTGRLGDFLVALPALAAIRNSFPNAEIALLTTASSNTKFAERTWRYAEPGNLPWVSFINPGLIDECIIISSVRSIAEVWRVRKAVAQFAPDTVIALPFSGEPWQNRLKKFIFLKALGAKKIFGLTRGARSLFSDLPREHQVLSALNSALEHPDVTKNEPFFGIQIPDCAFAWADSKIGELGWSRNAIVLVFCGGTYEHKRWPAEFFAQACRSLSTDEYLRFIFVGSSDERAIAEKARVAVGDISINVCGETNLFQLAALMKRSLVFFGNDSGPAHLAAALRMPSLVIMSSVHSDGIWDPYSPKTKILKQEVPCQGCLSETFCPFGHRDCVVKIAPSLAVAEMRLLTKQALADRASLGIS